MSRVTAIDTAILVGGRSKRMNRFPKGLLSIGGRSIVEGLMDICTDGTVFLVGDPDGPYSHLDCPIIPDRITGRGAPGGVLTALHYSTTEWTRILSCDLPRLTDSTLRTLRPCDGIDVIGYTVEGRRQYLVSLWHRRTRTVMTDVLSDSNPGFGHILKGLRTEWMEPPKADELTNLNTVHDAERLGMW